MLEIKGINISFPYKPYDCQIDYMTKVIECLESRQNALLESPTGTGKTLCLLCATVAWLTHQKKIKSVGDKFSDLAKIPKIIYTSRTHTQLNQVVSELRKTDYASSVTSTLLASREQLCIHPVVSKEANNTLKIQKCRNKMYHRTCYLFNNVQDYVNGRNFNGSVDLDQDHSDHDKVGSNIHLPAVPDIEDLIKIGNEQKICPYYTARELAKTVDLILMPYNYLVDEKSAIGTSTKMNHLTGGLNKKNRFFGTANKLDSVNGIMQNLLNGKPPPSDENFLQGAILIFDEAHNIEKVCEEAASVELTSLELACAIAECDTLFGLLMEQQKAFGLSNAVLVPNESFINFGTSFNGKRKKGVANNNNFEVLDGVTGAVSNTPFTDKMVLDYGLDELARVKETLLKIEETIDNFKFPTQTTNSSSFGSTNASNNAIWSIPFIVHEFLGQALRIQTKDQAQAMVTLLERLAIVALDARHNTDGISDNVDSPVTPSEGIKGNVVLGNNASRTNKCISALEKIATLLKTLFGLDMSTVINVENAISDPKVDTTRSSLAKRLGLSPSIESLYRKNKLQENNYLLQLIKQNMKHFKLNISYEETNKWRKNHTDIPLLHPSNKGATSRTLSLWCFSPSHTMKNLVSKYGIHSIILTSGTLSPLNAYSKVMNIPFPITLENGHIINMEKQVYLAGLSNGPDGQTLNSSYKNRHNAKYLHSLGMTILNVSRIVMGGILVFFPSYAQMNVCLEFWRNPESNLFNSFAKLKPVYIEPKSKQDLSNEIEAYYSTIQGSIASEQSVHTKSAILMAVCRGKLSEGYDFADTYARAVLIVGIPFPARVDPKVNLKIQYLNERYQEERVNRAKIGIDTGDMNGIDGNTWYKLEADRAINQAIGRVIRHKLDYGAILLCDERFSQQALLNANRNINNQYQTSSFVHGTKASYPGLPQWLKAYMKHPTNMGQVLSELRAFFQIAIRDYGLIDMKCGNKKLDEGKKQQKSHKNKDSAISFTSPSARKWIKDYKRIKNSPIKHESTPELLESKNHILSQYTDKSDTESFYSIPLESSQQKMTGKINPNSSPDKMDDCIEQSKPNTLNRSNSSQSFLGTNKKSSSFPTTVLSQLYNEPNRIDQLQKDLIQNRFNAMIAESEYIENNCSETTKNPFFTSALRAIEQEEARIGHKLPCMNDVLSKSDLFKDMVSPQNKCCKSPEIANMVDNKTNNKANSPSFTGTNVPVINNMCNKINVINTTFDMNGKTESSPMINGTKAETITYKSNGITSCKNNVLNSNLKTKTISTIDLCNTTDDIVAENIQKLDCIPKNNNVTDTEDLALNVLKNSLHQNYLPPNNTNIKSISANIQIREFKNISHFLGHCKKALHTNLDNYYALCETLKKYSRVKSILTFIQSINRIFELNPEHLDIVYFIYKSVIIPEHKTPFRNQCLLLYDAFDKLSHTSDFNESSQSSSSTIKSSISTHSSLNNIPHHLSSLENSKYFKPKSELRLGNNAKQQNNLLNNYKVRQTNKNPTPNILNARTVNDPNIAVDLKAKLMYREQRKARFEKAATINKKLKNADILSSNQQTLLTHFKSTKPN